MRLLTASLLLVVLLTPAESRAQQTPPAPQLAGSRPNVKVLKDLPDAQLFSLMNLISTSLGVHCDYCHVQTNPDLTKTPSNIGGWSFASDDKAQKRKAREMMQMVLDLNARLGGEHKVTCYTCHRGVAQPARTPPLPPPPGAAPTPETQPLPTVDRVWSNYVIAVGGQARFAPGAGAIYSGWDDRPEGRYARVELVVTNDRYHITLKNGDGTTTDQGIDSAGAWLVNNGAVQRFPTGPNLARLKQLAARYRPIKDRPADLQVVGIQRVGERDTYHLRARLDSVTTWNAYFDVASGLLRREMISTETMLIPLQEQIDYDDYRNVNGVQLPFFVRTTSGAPFDLVTRTFLQIRNNIPIDDALLRPPTAH